MWIGKLAVLDMTPLGWLGRKTSTQTNIYSVLLLLVFLSGRWFNMTELLLTAPKETICMKCQSLFSGKNRKNISKCHQLKILPSMQSVNNVCHTALAVFVVFFFAELNKKTRFILPEFWTIAYDRLHMIIKLIFLTLQFTLFPSWFFWRKKTKKLQWKW